GRGRTSPVRDPEVVAAGPAARLGSCQSNERSPMIIAPEASHPTAQDVDAVARTAADVRAAMETVISGRPDLVRLTVAVMLAEGHLLVEDVPGVGKTTLAKALARSLDCTVGRIQFTPDLLPSDLTGVTIYRAEQ